MKNENYQVVTCRNGETKATSQTYPEERARKWAAFLDKLNPGAKHYLIPSGEIDHPGRSEDPRIVKKRIERAKEMQVREVASNLAWFVVDEFVLFFFFFCFVFS